MTSTGSYQQPHSRTIGHDAKALQERLHELISRVAASIDIVKSWPESSGDDASIHVTTTSKLIASIRDVLTAISRVEGVVLKKSTTSNAKSTNASATASAVADKTTSNTKNNDGTGGDSELWKTLQQCPIPLDLLEMLDCSNGLNPEIFVRGLVREALSQLAGLRRRKVALEMLGNAIQTGLEVNTQAPQLQQNQKVESNQATSSSKTTLTLSGDRKRDRDEDDADDKECVQSNNNDRQPSKKAHIE